MSNRERVRPNDNQDFDLDDYLREKSGLESESDSNSVDEESTNRRKYGFWLIFVAIVFIYFMNPLGQFERFFGEGDNQLTEISVPEIPAPVVPTQQSILFRTILKNDILKLSNKVEVFSIMQPLYVVLISPTIYQYQMHKRYSIEIFLSII